MAYHVWSSTRALRRVVAGGAIVVALAAAACGGDASSGSPQSSTGQPQPQNGAGPALQDPKVIACLKEQGVTVPSGGRGNGQSPNGPQGDGPPPNGQPPSTQQGNGQPPSGQPPNGGGQNSAQFQKLRRALQKCGVTLRGAGPDGSPPQSQGTTATSGS